MSKKFGFSKYVVVNHHLYVGCIKTGIAYKTSMLWCCMSLDIRAVVRKKQPENFQTIILLSKRIPGIFSHNLIICLLIFF